VLAEWSTVRADAEKYSRAAAARRRAFDGLFWDSSARTWYDVDVRSGRRRRASAYAC
jgi:neutral trehalase